MKKIVVKYRLLIIPLLANLLFYLIGITLLLVYYLTSKKEPSWLSYALLTLIAIMILPIQLLAMTLAIKTGKKIFVNIDNIEPKVLKKLKEKDYFTTKNCKKWLNKYNLTYEEISK